MRKWFASAAAVVLAWAAPAWPQPKPHVRQIFVGVVDRIGTPVLDLGPSDFDIAEKGVKRQVRRAALAKNPMRIAMLLDTSDGTGPALTHIRAGLVDFLDAPPQHEVMLVSTGRQIRVRVPPTTDRRKLADVGRGLFSDGGATILMDALLEIDDRFLRNAEDRWPVFVIVTADGTESSAGANEKKFNDWLHALPARGIGVHAIALKYKGGGMPEIVASHVAQAAGGRYEVINTSNSLPAKMTAIAEQPWGSDLDFCGELSCLEVTRDGSAARRLSDACPRSRRFLAACIRDTRRLRA